MDDSLIINVNEWALGVAGMEAVIIAGAVIVGAVIAEAIVVGGVGGEGIGVVVGSTGCVMQPETM